MSPLLLAVLPIVGGAIKDEKTRRDLMLAGLVVGGLYMLQVRRTIRDGAAAVGAVVDAVPSPAEAVAGALTFPIDVAREAGRRIRTGPHYVENLPPLNKR